MLTELTEIDERCDAIEECYEFMLGYAGKGFPSDEGSQVRSHLQRALQAISGLAKAAGNLIEKHRLEPAGKYQAFLAVLRSEEHTSELQSRENLVCRLLLE